MAVLEQPGAGFGDLIRSAHRFPLICRGPLSGLQDGGLDHILDPALDAAGECSGAAPQRRPAVRSHAPDTVAGAHHARLRDVRVHAEEPVGALDSSRVIERSASMPGCGRVGITHRMV